MTTSSFAESKLGVNLTVVPEFHSHLESMGSLTREELLSHISFSYLLEQHNNNVISLPGPFPQSIDPSRFYSLFCSLYTAEFCP